MQVLELPAGDQSQAIALASGIRPEGRVLSGEILQIRDLKT
jgi:hypothetical protein